MLLKGGGSASMFILWSTADLYDIPKFSPYLGSDHFSPTIAELVVLNLLPFFFLLVLEI